MAEVGLLSDVYCINANAASFICYPKIKKNDNKDTHDPRNTTAGI